jgi:3-oxoadipate enol-lactonase
MSAAVTRVKRPQIFWRSRGSGPRTLVLINGYSASAVAWPRQWLRDLAAEVRVITVDNRGSGWSRIVDTPFTMQDMAGDVIDVLDDAEVDRAVIMGLSMGGMIAQEVALRAPERVAGLALVATRPPIPRFHQPPASSLISLVRPLLPGETLSTYFGKLWSAAAAPGFAEAHPEVIDELVQQVIERPTPRAMLMHQLRAMSGWGHAERLEHLAVPTLVVHGVVDTFAPTANGVTLAELIPDARLELIDGVGHLVAHEAPQRLTALLMELMTRAFPAPREAPSRATNG